MPRGRAVESLRLRLADAADAALGRRDRLTPPRRLRGFVGDSDFVATGEEFGDHLRSLAGLRSSDRVLDLGCGIGRMARVLARELAAPGSYDGFDVVAEGIAWCASRYEGLAAPFRFVHADIHNGMYNPGGSLSASEYRFPYPDASFDLVIATSVFTHLLPDAAERYLAESRRVLAPAGRLFATWMLGSTSDTLDGEPPETAVVYDESWVAVKLAAFGFELREPIHQGSWAGGAGLSYQDIIVADAV